MLFSFEQFSLVSSFRFVRFKSSRGILWIVSRFPSVARNDERRGRVLLRHRTGQNRKSSPLPPPHR